MPVKAVYYNKKNIINLFIDYFKKIFYFFNSLHPKCSYLFKSKVRVVYIKVNTGIISIVFSKTLIF